MASSAGGPEPRYEFDDLCLDVGQRRVWRGSAEVTLTRRTFALLRVLVERSPNVVAQAELADRIWGPSRTVTPENIAQHVKMLRRALRDDALRPRYVEVVRGEGYRLVPSVRAAAAPEADVVASEPPLRPRRRRVFSASVAAAVVAGIAAAASGIAVLVVGGHGAGEATEATASAALEVAARPLPSEADELVRALAHGGEGRPDVAEPWVSGRRPVSARAREAYDLYLEGLEWMARPEPGNYDAALSLLGRAVRLEPEFAHAYAMTAWLHARSLIHTTYRTSIGERHPEQIERLVVDNAERALALDPGLGRAYAALADRYETSWRWSEAEAAYRKAEALAPQDPYILYRLAWFDSFTGRHAEALALAARAVDVQPEFYRGWLDTGMAELYAGDPDAAAPPLYRASALAPGNLETRLMLGLTEAIRGNATLAEAQLRSVERLLGDARLLAYLPKLAMAYALLGREAEVARLVAEVEAFASSSEIGAGTFALTYLAAGDTERARRWLETSVEATKRNERDPGYYSLVSLKHNIFRHPALEEPEFRALRAQLQGS